MFHKPPQEFHTRIDPGEGFREHRRRHRRRIRNRRIGAAILLVGLAAGLTFGFRGIGGGAASNAPAQDAAGTPDRVLTPPDTPVTPERHVRTPDEMRGVHVTMDTANVPGKLDQYLKLSSQGLNTLQLDVKDETGKVAFVSSRAPLALKVGASKTYYDAARAIQKAHDRGVYTIARVVAFQDPVLAVRRPEQAVKTSTGAVWKNFKGLAWLNPYDRRNWDYNVDIAEAAADAGFDEVMFDYIRFPTDGPEDRVFAGATGSKARTIAAFLQYARNRLAPLGVKVSAAVFGLAATTELGIGQKPRMMARYLDTIHPMAYPSLYGPGWWGLSDPEAVPGETVARTLLDYQRVLRGLRVRIVPWIQDYDGDRRAYGLDQVLDQVDAVRRLRAGGFLLWNARGEYTTGALIER